MDQMIIKIVIYLILLFFVIFVAIIFYIHKKYFSNTKETQMDRDELERVEAYENLQLFRTTSFKEACSLQHKFSSNEKKLKEYGISNPNNGFEKAVNSYMEYLNIPCSPNNPTGEYTYLFNKLTFALASMRSIVQNQEKTLNALNNCSLFVKNFLLRMEATRNKCIEKIALHGFDKTTLNENLYKVLKDSKTQRLFNLYSYCKNLDENYKSILKL